jgi:hypothetical protein
MKVRCVTCCGVIQMIDVDGVSVQEALGILLVKTSARRSITTTG